jgi:hypothetical protein
VYFVFFVLQVHAMSDALEQARQRLAMLRSAGATAQGEYELNEIKDNSDYVRNNTHYEINELHEITPDQPREQTASADDVAFERAFDLYETARGEGLENGAEPSLTECQRCGWAGWTHPITALCADCGGSNA